METSTPIGEFWHKYVAFHKSLFLDLFPILILNLILQNTFDISNVCSFTELPKHLKETWLPLQLKPKYYPSF